MLYFDLYHDVVLPYVIFNYLCNGSSKNRITTCHRTRSNILFLWHLNIFKYCHPFDPGCNWHPVTFFTFICSEWKVHIFPLKRSALRDVGIRSPVIDWSTRPGFFKTVFFCFVKIHTMQSIYAWKVHGVV